MNLQRITRIQVLIAGVAVGVGVAILFVVVFVRPQQQRITRALKQAEEAQAYAQKRPAVEAELERATEQEREVTASYTEILEKRMPKIDLSDPIGGMVRLWELPSEEARVIENWFASTGAQVSGFNFWTFGTTLPDPTMRMMQPLNWTLTVQVKDFPALLEWLAKLPEAPRFMVMRSVTVQGARQPGQPLTASVPVTLYLWTGVEPARIAAAAAPAAGPGAGRGIGAGRRGPGGRGGRGARGRGGRGPRGRGPRGR